MATSSLGCMEKVGLEPALLARFVLACQSPTLLEAARELGQTPSALGIALRGLEERLGLQLFIRRKGGLALRPSAFWLFRSACRLLYMEQHIAHGRRHSSRPMRPLSIELDLTFAIGRFSNALVRATQWLIDREPDVLANWHFTGQDDAEAPRLLGTLTGGAMLAQRPPDVLIAYAPGNRPPSARAVKLHDDHWIIAAAAGTDIEHGGDGDALYYLRMRPALVEAVVEHARRGGWADQLRPIEAEPAELGDLLAQSRHRRIVMPASLLAARMGLVRHEHVALSPPLTSSLWGIPSDDAPPEADTFLSLMNMALGDEQKVAFAPQLSARQVQYYNLTAGMGGISAAARAANVSQSAMSANLGRMEAALSRSLLLRHADGVRITEAGVELLPFTTSLEEQGNWIIRRSHDLAAHAEARVTIGMLPSSGHGSALTERIAGVVARAHAQHPAWRLQVVEHSNTVLHDRVLSGDLNLAIVGAVGPKVSRIPLGPSEQLCVVCHPSIPMDASREIGLEEACALPLVLGPRHLSIHNAFAEAARKRGLPLHSEVEVGSLPLAVAMVKQAPLCTVLPASSVRDEIERGSLAAASIRRDELSGALWVIFSADRELSVAERGLIHELVVAFQPGHEPGLDTGD